MASCQKVRCQIADVATRPANAAMPTIIVAPTAKTKIGSIHRPYSLVR